MALGKATEAASGLRVGQRGRGEACSVPKCLRGHLPSPLFSPPAPRAPWRWGGGTAGCSPECACLTGERSAEGGSSECRMAVSRDALGRGGASCVHSPLATPVLSIHSLSACTVPVLAMDGGCDGQVSSSHVVTLRRHGGDQEALGVFMTSS